MKKFKCDVCGIEDYGLFMRTPKGMMTCKEHWPKDTSECSGFFSEEPRDYSSHEPRESFEEMIKRQNKKIIELLGQGQGASIPSPVVPQSSFDG